MDGTRQRDWTVEISQSQESDGHRWTDRQTKPISGTHVDNAVLQFTEEREQEKNKIK